MCIYVRQRHGLLIVTFAASRDDVLIRLHEGDTIVNEKDVCQKRNCSQVRNNVLLVFIVF